MCDVNFVYINVPHHSANHRNLCSPKFPPITKQYVQGLFRIFCSYNMFMYACMYTGYMHACNRKWLYFFIVQESIKGDKDTTENDSLDWRLKLVSNRFLFCSTHNRNTAHHTSHLHTAHNRNIAVRHQQDHRRQQTEHTVVYITVFVETVSRRNSLEAFLSCDGL